MHLEIGDPEYVKVFPDFQPMPAKCPRISKEENQSKFAYSSPFQVFSQEGLKVLKEIIRREENQGVYSSRGHKIALRGLYYLSPWVRDLQACTELRNHFCNIAGEELVPHPSFCNHPTISLRPSGLVCCEAAATSHGLRNSPGRALPDTLPGPP